MNDYILFMHDDSDERSPFNSEASWNSYFAMLRASVRFSGGSSIGLGECVSRNGQPKPITSHLSGYIRVEAESLEGARRFLTGNPVFESGGTVEIRELPRS